MTIQKPSIIVICAISKKIYYKVSSDILISLNKNNSENIIKSIFMDDAQKFQSYKELFAKSYVENSLLESEEVTEQELQILEELDSDEVYENIKDLVESLLQFKKSVRSSENSEVYDALKEYENAYKSLEEEFNVLETENQSLKSSNGELQEKIESLEKNLSHLSQKSIDLEKTLKDRDLELSALQITSKTDLHISFRNNSKIPILEELPEDIKQINQDLISPKVFTTPHNQITNNMNFNAPEPLPIPKRQTIKSVKFEYVINTAKAIDRTINIKTNNKNLVRNNHIPKIINQIHSRSTSDVQSSFKKT
ncbi:hypothetical protein SteCoe_3959 [Stentor coeruleus]|uniref:Uncharacterized protein n=1 Tax=Stentor coeruleus TaxID=5963 RepID=A0A1R2CVZ4_9CILI|nr:hypothetical protein SteCoe_3959 [Stentor coeruleus]